MLSVQDVRQQWLSRESKTRCLGLRMMPFVTAVVEGLPEETSQVGGWCQRPWGMDRGEGGREPRGLASLRSGHGDRTCGGEEMREGKR